MKKSWGLLEKILFGKKTIESRWYMHKVKPWDAIGKGEMIYFKNSGEPVTVRAEVDYVLQFENLNSDKVKEILGKYGEADGIERRDLEKYYELFKDKRYCMLIGLRKVEAVEPFGIDKTGFGVMAAWLVVESVEQVKV